MWLHTSLIAPALDRLESHCSVYLEYVLHSTSQFLVSGIRRIFIPLITKLCLPLVKDDDLAALLTSFTELNRSIQVSFKHIGFLCIRFLH
jgi:hypothetical protein